MTRSGHRASQREDEIIEFLALLQAEGVRRYLEVGARNGDTFHRVMVSLGLGAYGVAVDLPGAKWGWDFSERELRAAASDLCGRGQDVHIVIGDSAAPETIANVRALGAYDALLIDGDHSYAGVAADWRNYAGMARIVAFHDIDEVEQRSRRPIDVPRLWKETKQSYRHREIIGAERGMGIGVLWMS
jgi:hypothetical protein